MAHYAEVVNGTVVRVVVVANAVTVADGHEQEHLGAAFLEGIFPTEGAWVQTSYSASIRHNFAGIGSTWDGSGFAAPRLYRSWTLDGNYLWQPPTPAPVETRVVTRDGEEYTVAVPYVWDEEALAWVEADVPE
jgi:hypothetical protein